MSDDKRKKGFSEARPANRWRVERVREVTVRSVRSGAQRAARSVSIPGSSGPRGRKPGD